MRNGLLDLLKLLGAFCIVAAHLPPTDPVGRVLVRICPMALMPFFLTSGYYFLSSKMTLKEDSVRRRTRKIFFMTARWFVIYLVASTVLVYLGRGRFVNAPSMQGWINLLKSPDTWIGLLTMQYVPGIGYQLWFMIALVICNLFAWAVCRLKLKKVAYALILPVTVFHFALMAANARLNLDLHAMAISNAWTTGIPLFMLGLWFRENEQRILPRLSTPLLSALAVIGCITPLIAYCIYGHRAYYVGNYITGIALFLLALRYGSRFPETALTRFAGEASTTVYLVHTLFTESLRALASLWPSLSGPVNYFGIPFAFALCLGFHFVLRWLNAHRPAAGRGA